MRTQKSFLLCLVSMLILFFMSNTPIINADRKSELEGKISDHATKIKMLEEEINIYQENIVDTNEKSNTLKNEIKRIDNSVTLLNKSISLTEYKIAKRELEIENLGIGIASTTRTVYVQQNALANVLRTMDELERKNTIEVFLEYATIAEFFGVLEQLENTGISLQDNYKALIIHKADLKEKKNNAEIARADLANLKNEYIDSKKINQQKKQGKDTLLQITKNQETEYQKLLTNREKERKEILEEIQQIEDELRKLIDPKSIPKTSPGLLSWPIEGAVLTQNFGNTPDAKILYNGKPHNGIDVRARTGTKTLAASDGVVLEIGNTDAFARCLSYGKWIIINHENNLSTLYAHLSLTKVKKGDIVKRGDLIGYSGNSGYSTGPHLHFTVYDTNTIRFGPSKIPTSTCKFLPFGGYLNPMAYLP